ncbi:MAG: citramalate synthase [Candidatus Hydrogenedentota bacterium]
MDSKKIFIYDTTLRDGTQAEGIAFSVEDKIRITKELDNIGIDYIEGGWPGSNPISIEFFKRAKHITFKHSKLASFGSTRKAKTSVSDDPNIKAILEADTPVVTIFGKSWDLHVKDALKVDLQTNLEMIKDSVSYIKKFNKEVIYDAEHFFDGYINNKDYAIATLKAAKEGGADCLCLCETNGGRLYFEVFNIVKDIKAMFPDIRIGIHTHNDSELGVANTLAGVEAGAEHVQGTVNGIGERCGNANLISIIANLELKMNYKCLLENKIRDLTYLSRFVYELANLAPNTRQPFVGKSAFAHKGGIHVDAVVKNPQTYEHIDPELIGNERRVLISDQSGQSNLLYRAEELGLPIKKGTQEIKTILKVLKDKEFEGYQYEAAEGSFILLVKKLLGLHKDYFTLVSFRIIIEKETDIEEPCTATVKVRVHNKEELSAGEGDGPVNALDNALRKALLPFYPELKEMSLVDYKVRVLEENRGTAAKVVVLITSSDGTRDWGTIGVAENIVEASYIALADSFEYMIYLYREKLER